MIIGTVSLPAITERRGRGTRLNIYIIFRSYFSQAEGRYPTGGSYSLVTYAHVSANLGRDFS